MENVLKSKKPRKNYRKGRKTKKHSEFVGRLMLCLRAVGGIALVVVVSAVFVFSYDFLTQCDHFKAQGLVIEGNQRLSKEQIAEQAQLRPGMNILAANLPQARKRLLAHPWISEVEVFREIPPGLTIKIKEHAPLAIVDLGRKFLINDKGEIFKEWSPTDPHNLPLVSGLEISDLTAHDRNLTAVSGLNAGSQIQATAEQIHAAPLDAVMDVLRLGKEKGSILPNDRIQQIRVDREIGITVQLLSEARMINLGYNDYSNKYNALKAIFSFLNNESGFPDVDRIDLNNLNRIVVSPSRLTPPPGDDKEV